MARMNVKCPHCNKEFVAEGGGKTADVRAFGKSYRAAHPTASVSDAFRAYFKDHPEANPNTVLTQLRGVM